MGRSGNRTKSGCVFSGKEKNDSPGTGPLPRPATEPDETKNSPIGGVFRVFARGCMHAFGVHWPLEKCKKPRTGRGFLRIDEKWGK